MTELPKTYDFKEYEEKIYANWESKGYFRPTEVDYLLCDPTKAKTKLGWEPKIKFHELVRIMVDADLELLNLPKPGEGKRIIDEKFNGWHRWEHQVVSMDK